MTGTIEDQIRWLRLEIEDLRNERDMWKERATKRAAVADVEKGKDQTLNLRVAVSQWLLAESLAPKEVLWHLCMKAYHELCAAAKLK